MKAGPFVFVAVISLFASSRALEQPAPLPKGPGPRGSVHVQELKMPPKAAKAFEKGSTLLFSGDYQASLAPLQKATELAPDLFPPFHNLGLAQYNLGNLDAAAQNFQKAIDLSQGSFAPSYFSLGMIYYDRAQFAEACRIIQRGLLVDPNSVIGNYFLGVAQYALGNLADAQRCALEVLRIDPHFADAYILLAHTHERLHHPSDVLAAVEAYSKFTSNHHLQADASSLAQRAQQDLTSGSAN